MESDKRENDDENAAVEFELERDSTSFLYSSSHQGPSLKGPHQKAQDQGGHPVKNPRGISHPSCDSDVNLAADCQSTCVRLRVKQGVETGDKCS